MLVDIRLQVLRIGVHGAEFIYLKLASVFPYPIESNEQTIEPGGYRLRTETPSGNHIAEVAHFMVIYNFKTAIAQSSKHLRTRENAVFALGNIKIQARGHHQTREDAFVKIYKRINYSIDYAWIALENLLFGSAFRFKAAYKQSIVGQFIINHTKHLIDTSNLIERHKIDDGILVVILEFLEVINLLGS